MAKLRRFSATPVAEGVRLEVGKYTVFAVRNEDRDISVRVRREPRVFLRACMRIPFMRGSVRLIRDVLRFFDGLGESAELRPRRPVRGTAPEQKIAAALRIRSQTIATLVSAILILAIAAVCLYAAPAGMEAFLLNHFALSRAALNLTVSIARIFGLLVAVGFVGRLRVFKRLLMYKGAINKVINCYECREDVNIENIASYPIHTRRSEPAFLICALSIAFLLFPLIKPHGLVLTAALRILVLLAVAAVLNEPFSALEEAKLTLPVRIARAPIDLLQHMTTLEPHPQMLEVAVCAFNAAMGKESVAAETEVTSNDHRGMDEARD